MPPGMRRDDDEGAMKRLGDFPMDHGQQEPTRLTAMAKLLKPYGYAPAPADVTIRRKFEAESRANVGELLRLRELLEGTNIVSQEHPIHDAPFFAKEVHYSARAGVFGADAVFVVPLGDAGNTLLYEHHVGFVRTIYVDVFDATANADLRVFARVANNLVEGFDGIAPNSLINMQRNSLIRVMPNQSLVISVRNNSAFVPHDAQVRVHGWRYPVADIKETARGTIPKEN